MSPKKRKFVKTSVVDAGAAGALPDQTAAPSADQPALDESTGVVERPLSEEGAPDEQASDRQKRAINIRSYKTTLTMADKGVTLGVRNGHDWIVSFPGDPGKDVKDDLKNAGFAYNDRKWKIFTNVINRPAIETLIKDLKRRLGEEIDVREYVAKQVVLDFAGWPGDAVIEQLKENGFYFRPDKTWNAENTPDKRTFAHELIKSLPPVSRLADASQSMAR
jgi:hypothetical protein